jgi:hypothetical protein
MIYEAVQESRKLGDDQPGRVGGVDREMGAGGMTAWTFDADGELVGRRSDRSCSQAHLARPQCRVDMKSDDPLDTFEDALVDQVLCAARKLFFCMLEHEPYRAFDVELGESNGQTDRNTRVRVMPACMHEPRMLGSEWQIRLFLNGERVDVGAKRDGGRS